MLEPPRDCGLCPHLVEFRRANQKAYPDYFNGPAPTFGPADAAVMISGLAPGLHGANRTGRPFTGDYAGDLLFATLGKLGFTAGQYAADPDDGFTLKNLMIANSVRCVPPQNKPTPAEIATCRPFLVAQIGALKNLRAIVALGRIAHESTLAALGVPARGAPFAHGAVHAIGPLIGSKPGAAMTMKFNADIALFDSYHCSRYNTNTGRLTAPMFEAVFAAVRDHLSA